MLAYYIQNWDPIIFEITERFALRWYGLAYVMGFVMAFFVLRQLSRKKLWIVEPDKVSDVVTFTAFFGVFLGGRIGYVLFYMIPEQGWSVVQNDPLVFFKVWQGGMASHGAVIGIFLFTLYYSLRHKISWTGLGDGLCVAAPIGIIFGRFANFINGELYGRVTDSSLAIKFPQSLLKNGHLSDALAEASQHSDQIQPLVEKFGLGHQTLAHVQEIARDNPAVLQALGNHVQPRHASQLYEMALEGIVLFAILYGLRLAVPKLKHGILTSLFFILYAAFRIIVENVREPDADLFFPQTALEMTAGQFYSTFMILVGLVFLLTSYLKSGKGWTYRTP